MRNDYKKCQDDDDARRMAETILRTLGYSHINLGANEFDVRYEYTESQLLRIAQNAERIARWARTESKLKQA